MSKVGERRPSRLALGLVLGVLAVRAVADVPTPVASQTPTSGALAEPARGVAAAFRAVADAAGAAVDDADWQRVDATYNNVLLAAIDLHRPAFAGAGADGAPALAAIDGALARLGAALDGLDAAGIRAEADAVAAVLDLYAPGLAGGAPTVASALAEWRGLRADYERLFARQQAGEDTWRDMRNAAIALIDRVDARAPAVVAAVPGQALTVQRLGVLALRLRMAALQQSSDEAAAAGRLTDAALDALDRAAATAGVPAPAPEGPLVFEGQPVVASPGQTVAIPIIARGVAEAGGLGGFVLDIRWSPRALQMERVEWGGLGGSAASATDAAAGHHVLELPPAPVGPEVDTEVARLMMTVLGVTPDPADLLPPGALTQLEGALGAAAAGARSGDLAAAGAALFAAYAAYADGQGTPGSLAARFAAVGQAELVDAAWLALLERISRPEPAGTDAVIEAIEGARAALAGAVGAHGAALGADGGIPIVIEVISATDLRGRPIAARASVPARVLTTGLIEPPAGGEAAPGAAPPAGGLATTDGDPASPPPPVDTVPDDVPAARPADATPAPTGPAATSRDARRLAALVALAVVAGALAALASARRGSAR